MKLVITGVCGALLWTLMEYLIHRFMAHEYNWPNAFRSEHLRHHFVKDYFAPSWKKLITALVVLVAMFGSTIFFMELKTALTFTVCFTVMYLIYELTHWSFHVFGPTFSYGRKMRKHHFYHHFVNDKMNHGVTTTLWDRVFRTYVKADQVLVNKKYTMRWLPSDPSGSVVIGRYCKDYKIVPRTRVT